MECTQVLEGLRAEARAAEQAHMEAVAAARSGEAQLWQQRLQEADVAAQKRLQEAEAAAQQQVSCAFISLALYVEPAVEMYSTCLTKMLNC